MANIHDDERHGGIDFYPGITGRDDNIPPANPDLPDILNDLQNEDRNTVGITTPRSVRPAETPIVISKADEFMIGNRFNFLIYVSTRSY